MVDFKSTSSPTKNSYEKKRYYYSKPPHIKNNYSVSNPTPNARYGPNNLYSKKSYQNISDSKQYNYSSSYPYPQTNNETKPSRYDPSSSAHKSVSTSRLSGSRYNPEEKINLTDASHDSTSSRYSGSRYNSQQKSIPQTLSNTNIETASRSNTTSVPYDTTNSANIKHIANRHRPRSAVELSSKNHSNGYYPNSLSATTESFSVAHANLNKNNSESFCGNSSKWKQTSSPPLNHSPNQSLYDQEHFNTKSSWKNHNKPKVSNSLTYSYVAPTPKRYSSGSLAKLNYSSEINETNQHTINSKYGNEQTQNVTTFTKNISNNDNEALVNHENSIKSGKNKDESTLMNIANPHSLGSSLINSSHPKRKIEHKNEEEQQNKDIFASTTIEPSTTEEDTKVTKIGTVAGSAVTEKSNNKIQKNYLWSPPHKHRDTIDDSMSNEFEFEKDSTSDNESSVFANEKDFSEFNKLSTFPATDIYEYIYDPTQLKTDLEKVKNEFSTLQGYPTPIKPISSCIFPMTESQTRLWILKNQPREKIISQQKYLLKTPIKSFKSYPFTKKNLLIHQQAVKPILLEALSEVKRQEETKILKLKKNFLIDDEKWKKNCEQLDEFSNEIRVEEFEAKRQEEKKREEKLHYEQELLNEQNKAVGSSRRRNRADFVDDTEMESVLLQIDPDYKHHQTAATIPDMILNPIEKHAIKFKDVNNLVTNKNLWSSRILKDGIDNFTEYEHELFVEGYLTHPKKFGKISHHMGGLRTPEECVLHYYRTKRRVDYRKLLADKNKKRKSTSTKKSRKKKDKNDQSQDINVSLENENSVTAKNDTSEMNNRNEDFQENEEQNEQQHSPKNIVMEQVEIVVPVEEKPVQQEIEQVTELQQQPIKVQQNELPNVESQQQESPQESSLNENVKPFEHEVLNNYNDTANPNKRTYSSVEATDYSESHYNEDLININYENISGDLMDSQTKKARQLPDHKSSYWSVKEANLFPDLLRKHGSQWSLISAALGTKSPTMVRNYYQRNAAQQGWKLLVEDADTKRNATSSGSVQQSQILIQSGQVQPLYIQNGIPIQQKPALGFFSSPEGDFARHNSPGNMTPTVGSQPFSPDVVNKDLFPSLESPSVDLPPPRLPSIHFGKTSALAVSNTDTSNSSSQTESTPSNPLVKPVVDTASKPVYVGSKISDILNSVTSEDMGNKLPNVSPVTSQTTKQVITQEPQISMAKPRASITSLLNVDAPSTKLETSVERLASRTSIASVAAPNVTTSIASNVTPAIAPIAAKPINAPSIPISHTPATSSTDTSVANHSENVTQISQQDPAIRMPSFNFTTDPLAALAAIASAPEAMASFLPDSSESRPSQ